MQDERALEKGIISRSMIYGLLFIIALFSFLYMTRLLMPGGILLGFTVGMVHRLYLKSRKSNQQQS